MIDYQITKASIIDTKEILCLQKIAYQSEAAIYNDYSIPPLLQTLAEINNEFASKIFFKTIIESILSFYLFKYFTSSSSYFRLNFEISYFNFCRIMLFTQIYLHKYLSFYKSLNYFVFSCIKLSSD